MLANQREKYSTYGMTSIANFPQSLEGSTQPRLISLDIGGIDGWHLHYEVVETNGIVTSIIPLIYLEHPDPNLTFKVRYFFNIHNNEDPESFVMENTVIMNPTTRLLGIPWSISKILSRKDTLIVDGLLGLAYGIHVIAIFQDNIWKFNFHNQIFNHKEDKTMIQMAFVKPEGNQYLLGHEQLLLFHSEYFRTTHVRGLVYRNVSTHPNRLEHVEKCYQIAHGVRVELTENEIIQVISHAGSLKNVIRYCELQYIQKDFQVNIDFYAIMANMRFVLNHLLKKVKSSGELKYILEVMDLDQIPSEAMKMCTKRFFEFTI